VYSTLYRTERTWISLLSAALLVGAVSWLQVAPTYAASISWLVLPGPHLATEQALVLTSAPTNSIPMTPGTVSTPSTAITLKLVVKGTSTILSAAKLRKTTVSPYVVVNEGGGQYTLEHFSGKVTGYSTSGSGTATQTTVKFSFSLATFLRPKSCTRTPTGAPAGCVIPANHLNIGAKSSSPAHGTAIAIAVLATDVMGQRVRGYTGTIHFRSTSPATLPADYTFTSANAGFRAFKGVVFPAAGSNTVTVTDTAAGGTSGKRTFTVT
jgi:hypothetical protein